MAWADPQFANTALKRYGHVDNIAAMVAFVAGPEASYITGANLTVHGGTNARRRRVTTVEQVRLLDESLDTLMTLVGAPTYFKDFAMSPDGRRIRATSTDIAYEADLRPQTFVSRARDLLESWAAKDSRDDFRTRALAEQDWRNGAAILRQAVSRFPLDPELRLHLANRLFGVAADDAARRGALEQYDRSVAYGPFDPVTRYMRGRARATLNDPRAAPDDFEKAIDLPHILPIVKVIAGFLNINESISRLSYKLNLGAKSELYLRRARACLQISDWPCLL